MVQVVHKVVAEQVPFVFLTNGGGVHESVRASQLSKMLDIEVSFSLPSLPLPHPLSLSLHLSSLCPNLGLQIHPNRVILSHTPCQDFVPEYGNKLVLVSGGKNDECGAIAESYLFGKGREERGEERERRYRRRGGVAGERAKRE